MVVARVLAARRCSPMSRSRSPNQARHRPRSRAGLVHRSFDHADVPTRADGDVEPLAAQPRRPARAIFRSRRAGDPRRERGRAPTRADPQTRPTDLAITATCPLAPLASSAGSASNLAPRSSDLSITWPSELAALAISTGSASTRPGTLVGDGDRGHRCSRRRVQHRRPRRRQPGSGRSGPLRLYTQAPSELGGNSGRRRAPSSGGLDGRAQIVGAPSKAV
jgi:hypothetical protein